MPSPDPPWSFSYHDGNGNAYHLRDAGSGAMFEYLPVRPEHSSTGRYSGGEPRSGPIDASTAAALWAQIATLEADTALHITERGKDTGAFSFRDATGDRGFTIKRSFPLAAFDALIARL